MSPPALHCVRCGTSYPPLEPGAREWPRTCGSCAEVSYRNPVPVTVMLLPVTRQAPTRLGLLAIRRTIEPGAGQLALPGGYVDWLESWQQAGARELVEETGVVVDPDAISVFDVKSPPDGRTVLLFGLAPPVPSASLPVFTPTNETGERVILDGPQEMAFPLHTAVVEAFFAAAEDEED